MNVVQVNTDIEEEIITQQGIRSIPTFEAFKDGVVVKKFRGKLTKLELLGELRGIVSEDGEEGSQEEAAEDSPEPDAEGAAEESETDQAEASPE